MNGINVSRFQQCCERNRGEHSRNKLSLSAREECDPENFDSTFKELSEALKEEDPDLEEEINDSEKCLYTYLRQYIDFASTEHPTNSQISRLYRRTLDMIDGAIRSREAQKDDVEEQQRILEEMLAFDEDVEWVNDEPTLKEGAFGRVEHDVDAWWDAKYVKEELDNDMKFLNNMKKSCWLADDRLSKTQCVERFVQATHSRGPYLSTGCHLPLPERIIEEEGEPDIRALGIEATDLTKNVLDCLRRYE